MDGIGSQYTQPLTMRIGPHQEDLVWEIGTLEEGIDGYLPVAWLSLHNPDVDWAKPKLSWRSEHCKRHCLPMSYQQAVKNFVQLLQEGKPYSVGATEWHDEEGGDIAEKLPLQYRPWASVFSEEEINKLPEHGTYDHEIKLVEGAIPPFGPIYPLSEKELTELRGYLQKELESGKIRKSKSPAAAPIIFVPKADKSLRMCVDY